MWILWAVLGLIVAVAVYDVLQRKHAILRNFPVIGHLRYLLEAIGPELRQYIVTNNDEERPFSRDQRRWVYASSKKQNNYFGFGTDNDLERGRGYLILRQATFGIEDPRPGDEGHDPDYLVPCAKVLGGGRGRRHAFRPASVFAVSAMSYGSLSAPAVEAINRGCGRAHALHNTGEGGIASHHDHGGGLIYQLGTGYFGSRADDGSFSMERFRETVAAHDVRAIEIKLSQGAKPGRGGVLPAAKVTPEISRVRGVPMGQDVLSPASHRAFSCADSLLDFVESLAEATGVPVGIKSAVGEDNFWGDLARLMARGDRGVDFIAVDGGEGGTGAAPLVFSDHVSLPFKIGFPRVYQAFVTRGVADKVVFMGSGRLGFPESAALAMGLGCDMVGVAREAMLAIGCIQAQRCHSGHCPTGVATQNRWLLRGLDPTHKAWRLANYLTVLRKELLWLTRAAGVEHPSLLTLDHFEMLEGELSPRSAREVFGYQPGWGLPGRADAEVTAALMRQRVIASGCGVESVAG